MSQARKCCSNPCKSCFIFILGLVLLLFIVTFGVVPIIFKYSVEIQRNLIFPTWLSQESNYTNPEIFNLSAARNFYLKVNETENITLGIWQILPRQYLNATNKNYDFDQILADNSSDVLLYLHGNGANRALHHNLYRILRIYFHVIAPDYRGYADSTKAELTEQNIVSDISNLYKWIQNRTDARIFVWGHSLGTGVSTHTLANLKKDSITPAGLVLEAPFSSVTDVIEMHPVARFFAWLPWFESAFIAPMHSNGFGFDSKTYIKDVDCPIMILHAIDDSIIPYQLATRLYETAMENRNVTAQGNVTYHLFEEYGYDHMDILKAPELPSLIENFIDSCNNFQKSKQ